MTGGFKEVMKPGRPSDLRYLLIWLWQGMENAAEVRIPAST